MSRDPLDAVTVGLVLDISSPLLYVLQSAGAPNLVTDFMVAEVYAAAERYIASKLAAVTTTGATVGAAVDAIEHPHTATGIVGTPGALLDLDPAAVRAVGLDLVPARDAGGVFAVSRSGVMVVYSAGGARVDMVADPSHGGVTVGVALRLAVAIDNAGKAAAKVSTT